MSSPFVSHVVSEFPDERGARGQLAGAVMSRTYEIHSGRRTVSTRFSSCPLEAARDYACMFGSPNEIAILGVDTVMWRGAKFTAVPASEPVPTAEAARAAPTRRPAADGCLLRPHEVAERELCLARRRVDHELPQAHATATSGSSSSNPLLREPLLRELEPQALGTLAPVSERRVAPGALCLREVGIEDRALLVPLRPLGTRHLTNHQSTRRDLDTYVLELRLASLSCSFLHSPHRQSLVVMDSLTVMPCRRTHSSSRSRSGLAKARRRRIGEVVTSPAR